MIKHHALGTGRMGFTWPLEGAETVANVNTGYINALAVWGHSYIDTINSAGTESAWQISNKLASALGVSWPLARSYGAGGTTVINDWVRFMTTMRPFREAWGGTGYTSQFVPQFLMYGYNDVIQLQDPSVDSSQGLNNWINCYRAILRWGRSTSLYPPDYIFGDAANEADLFAPWNKAGVTYGGTWTQTVTPAFDPDASSQPTAYHAPHSTSYFTTATNATVDIRLPPRYPGTPITLYVRGEYGTTGATTVTVSNPGGSMASFVISTNNRVRNPPYISFGPNRPTIVPITVTLPVGDGTNSQTLRLAPSAYAAGGRFTFLGWGIEAIFPPLIVVANVPTPANTTIMTQATFASLCSSHYNPGIDTAAAEMEPLGSVVVADMATAADGIANPGYYSPNDIGFFDDVHPNSQGKEVMAKEFLEAANRIPLDVRHLMAPTTADWMADSITMLTASAE